MKAIGIGIVGLVVVVAIAVAAIGGSAGTAPATGWPSNGVPHEQLESDRIMTQQMGVDVGPGMQAGMPANGMLGRSMSASYVRMLEQHATDIDRMLARRP
ncbi:MAG: hypothetical protein WEB06_10665 [Actinomycetota bacterium]